MYIGSNAGGLTKIQGREPWVTRPENPALPGFPPWKPSLGDSQKAQSIILHEVLRSRLMSKYC
jgi:hypothetical protein